MAEEAIEKATLYPEAITLEPGRYDTIFEEYALADLIRFLGYIALAQKRSSREEVSWPTAWGRRL